MIESKGGRSTAPRKRVKGEYILGMFAGLVKSIAFLELKIYKISFNCWVNGLVFVGDGRIV